MILEIVFVVCNKCFVQPGQTASEHTVGAYNTLSSRIP